MSSANGLSNQFNHLLSSTLNAGFNPTNSSTNMPIQNLSTMSVPPPNVPSLLQLQLFDLLVKAQQMITAKGQVQQQQQQHYANIQQKCSPTTFESLRPSPNNNGMDHKNFWSTTSSDRSSPNCADQNGDNSSRRRRRAVANLDNTLDGLVAKRAEQMPMKRRYQSETEAIELPDDELETKRMEADPDVCTRMCSVCGYQGKWVSEMIRHKRVHTSDRPFKCKYCNRTSKWKADLIRHVAKTHGIRVVSKYSRSKAFELGKPGQQPKLMLSDDERDDNDVIVVVDSGTTAEGNDGSGTFSSANSESGGGNLVLDENNNNRRASSRSSTGSGTTGSSSNQRREKNSDSLNSMARKAQRLSTIVCRSQQVQHVSDTAHMSPNPSTPVPAKANAIVGRTLVAQPAAAAVPFLTGQQLQQFVGTTAAGADLPAGVHQPELPKVSASRPSSSLTLLQLLSNFPQMFNQFQNGGQHSSCGHMA
uniref:C2H2-type domain-containing protein n=1 Tax=Globodera rostochiensis TaxID=31243 RepID=A0A914H3T8_GLORO